MPIRTCKTEGCGHPYYMHSGAEANRSDGACNITTQDRNGFKVKPCPCTQYDHDPASGPFG